MAGSFPSRTSRRERLPMGSRAEALSCISVSQFLVRLCRPWWRLRLRGPTMIRQALQSPPPPPPPMIPPGGGAVAVPQNLASPGLRLVGGLIDLIILIVVLGLLEGLTRGQHTGSSLVDLVVTLAYFGYFLSQRGQSVGMM